jgi:hypothetical protein
VGITPRSLDAQSFGFSKGDMGWTLTFVVAGILASFVGAVIVLLITNLFRHGRAPETPVIDRFSAAP